MIYFKIFFDYDFPEISDLYFKIQCALIRTIGAGFLCHLSRIVEISCVMRMSINRKFEWHCIASLQIQHHVCVKPCVHDAKKRSKISDRERTDQSC